MTLWIAYLHVSPFSCHRFIGKHQVFSGFSQHCIEVRLSGDLVDSISPFSSLLPQVYW